MVVQFWGLQVSVHEYLILNFLKNTVRVAIFQHWDNYFNTEQLVLGRTTCLLSSHSLYKLSTNNAKDSAAHSSSTVTRVFIVTAKCLPCHCLTMTILPGSTIPPFKYHVTLLPP